MVLRLPYYHHIPLVEGGGVRVDVQISKREFHIHIYT